MTQRGRNIIILSQLSIIIVFLVGMMLNNHLLRPFIDCGETARLEGELDDYSDNFRSESGCDVRNAALRDSVLKLNPVPYDGECWIMETDGEIIWSKDGSVGSGFDAIARSCGDAGVNLLKSEADCPSLECKMDYVKGTSMYVKSLQSDHALFFCALDYSIAGSKFLRTYYILLLVRFLGAILILCCAFVIIKRVIVQERTDLLVRQELDTAAEIQKSMLPVGERHLMQLDVNARLIPAKKVGGDLYSYNLRNGMLYFCIGDVSGKGVPASLFMTKAVALFRSYATSDMTPAMIAKNLNEDLCRNNYENMFLTGIIGTVKVSDGLITYVNAGHEPPVVWDGKDESNLSYLKSSGNIPLGVDNEVEFVEDTYTITKNGMVFMYTDGISEARNANQRLLGREGLLNTMEKLKNKTSKGINDSLLSFIFDFESGTDQSDDITLLTFRNNPTPKQLQLKNKVGELKKISAFLNDVFKECTLDHKNQVKVRTGLDEALTNCVYYAYESEGLIDVTASIESSKLIFTIKDGGKEFNPLEYDSSKRDELKTGGFGISIYKANFDCVLYERKDETNILKLIKQL